MEFFDSQAEEPTTVCGKEIEECDLFLGIYAHRYGFLPKGSDKSITQMEYEPAIQLGKKCHCFIVDAKFPWEPDFIAFEKRYNLKTFLNEVKEKHVFSCFTDRGTLKPNSRLLWENGSHLRKDQIPQKRVSLGRRLLTSRIWPGMFWVLGRKVPLNIDLLSLVAKISAPFIPRFIPWYSINGSHCDPEQ